VSDTVVVSPTVLVGNVFFGLSDRTLTVHLRAGHPRVVRVRASAESAVRYFRAGDKIDWGVTGRNGKLALAGAKIVR
jgi:uncharacterized protein (DUF58 family)